MSARIGPKSLSGEEGMARGVRTVVLRNRWEVAVPSYHKYRSPTPIHIRSDNTPEHRLASDMVSGEGYERMSRDIKRRTAVVYGWRRLETGGVVSRCRF